MVENELIIGSSPRSLILEHEALVSSASAIPTLPVESWKEVDDRPWGSPIRDQRIYQTCAGFSLVTTFDITMRKLRATPPLLSSTYPFILGGGGPKGSLLSKVYASFDEKGTCPEQYCPDYLILPNMITSSATEHAIYKPIDNSTKRLFSVEEMGTALVTGATLAAICAVDRRIGIIDGNGICPLAAEHLGYHAWCVLGLQRVPAGVKSRLPWMFLVQSSWGKSWGRGGYAFLLAEHFEQFGRPVTAFAFWPGRQNGV